MRRPGFRGYFGLVLVAGTIVCAVLFARRALAQTPANPLRGTWRTHTCADCILSVDVGDDAVWAGTVSAGVVRLDRATGAMRILTSADGLDTNTVRMVDVGPDGAVWVATARRLASTLADSVSHWDGTRWTTHVSGAGLPGSPILDIAAGAGGSVWVATGAGLARFDGATWRTYTTSDGLPSDSVTAVDVAGASVWAGTESGAAEWMGTRFAVVPTSDLPAQRIDALSIDADGMVWAVAGQRLAHYNPGGWAGGAWWRVHTPPGPFSSDPMDPSYFRLFHRPGGDPWICCGAGRRLQKFDGQAWSSVDVTAESGLPWLAVAAIGNDDALWIGTPNEGLARRQLGQWTQFRTGLGPTNLVAFSAAVDSSDRPWVGYFPYLNADNLVNHLEAGQWVREDSRTGMLRVPTVLGVVQNALSAGDDGSVWVGVDHGGVARYDAARWTTWTITDVVGASAAVRGVAADDRGGAWVATGLGAAHFAGGAWRLVTTADGLPTNALSAVAVDHRTVPDTLWFGGTQVGAVRWDGSATGWRTFGTADGLARDDIQDILIDETRDAVWFAHLNAPECVSVYDGSTWRTYGAAEGLVGDGVWDLALAPDGAVWAAVVRDGGTETVVSRFDGASWATFSVADGLVGGAAFGVAVDRAGKAWVASLGGISEFTPEQGGYPYPAPSPSAAATPSSVPPTPTAPTTPGATATRAPTVTASASAAARTATPSSASCVCTFIRSRVPAVVVNDALANPSRYAGWMQPRDPKKRESPYNPRRTCLSIERLSVPYHVLANPVVWKAGCP